MNEPSDSHEQARPGPAADPTVGRPGRQWSGRAILALVVSCSVLVGAILIWRMSPGPNAPVAQESVEPPLPDLTQAAPAVADIMIGARENVVANVDSATAWGEYGMVCFSHQFERETNECFTRAAQLNPRDYRWPYLLGLSIGVADPIRSEQAYRDAIEIEPQQALLHLRLAELLLGQQLLDKAEKSFQACLAIETDNARAQLGLARIEQLRGSVSSGLEWALKAAASQPNYRDVHTTLAQLHRLAGDVPQARAALARAEEPGMTAMLWEDPLSATILELRRDSEGSLLEAEAMAAEGRTEDALRLLNYCIAADDRNPSLYTAVARLLIQANQFENATLILDRAERRHPSSAEIAFQIGNRDFFAEQYDAARERFTQAIQRKPDYALAHYNLGHTCLKLGDKDAALSAFQAAVSIQPNHVDARANVGRLLLDKKQVSLALEQLRIAADQDPNDAFIQKTLAEAEAAAQDVTR
jgi:tetratricopeptide (TPR) repeat protein